MDELSRLVARAERVLARLEELLPPPAASPDWQGSIAWRWRHRGRDGGAGFAGNPGELEPVRRPDTITLADLQDIDDQKARVDRNTRQFVEGRGANNVLLTGARGTGKSSLVKAVLNAYAYRGLRLIEVDRNDLVDLPEIVERISARPERFILYCDDLSFESGEPGYRALKTVLDGSIATPSDNVVIYATSNRRHLLPETLADNAATRHVDEEIHPGEAVEEKISLSERFGLWVSFYPFDQQAYLDIVEHWVAVFGTAVPDPLALRREALQWSLLRGARNGRVAWQFARDWAGR